MSRWTGEARKRMMYCRHCYRWYWQSNRDRTTGTCGHCNGSRYRRLLRDVPESLTATLESTYLLSGYDAAWEWLKTTLEKLKTIR